jgi:hypothetical protein
MTMEPKTLEQIQADPTAVIREALEWHPDLWWGGLFSWSYEHRRGVVDGTSPGGRLTMRREATLDERSVGQLIRAAEFIAWAPRIKSLNRSRASYGWKHVAERFRKLKRPDADYYVGEGMFIIAARAMGLTLSGNGYDHYYVNLSERAAKELRERDDEFRRRRWGSIPERISV